MKYIHFIFPFFIAVFLFSLISTIQAESPVISPPATSAVVNPSNFLDQLYVSKMSGKVGGPCLTQTKIPSVNLGAPSGPFGDIGKQFTGWFNDLIGRAIDPITSLFAGPIITTMRPAACLEGVPSDILDPKCTCLPEKNADFANLCTQILNARERGTCINECSKHGIWTAIGCVDFNLQDFITHTVFGWGLGVAGAISFGCIIFSAISIQISSGSPDKIKKAQEMLTSCILGLILIIFSVFLLRLIGVSILTLPGFG